MMTRTRSIALAVLAASTLMLGACSGETNDMLQDVSQMDPDAIRDSGAEIQAAGKMCSEAAGKLSPALQDLFGAVKDKDLAAAQAAGDELQAIADQLHQAETDGVAAAQGMASLPGDAGTQATQGIETGFKACGNAGDEAEGLATAVANASEADLDGALQKEIDKVREAAMDAQQDIAGV